MSTLGKCEYCSRPIKSDPVRRVLREQKHTFCSEFCFRLHFYDVPTISYDDLQKVYSYYTVSLPAEEYEKIIHELITAGEG